MAVLRYTGQIAQTFKDVSRMPDWRNPTAPPLIARVGELKPGQEFSVPDELADRYIGRPDIEVIVPPLVIEDAAPAADAEDQPQDAAPEQGGESESAPAETAAEGDPAPAKAPAARKPRNKAA